jgi:hypothetical protein
MNGISERQIDELLRRDFAGGVAEDGFSVRVTRALPARRKSRPWMLPTAALAGSLLAWLALLPSPLLQQAAQEWVTGNLGATSAGVGVLLLGVSMLGCGWALDES